MNALSCRFSRSSLPLLLLITIFFPPEKSGYLVTYFALYETCDIFYVKRLAAAAPSFTAFLCPNNLLQPCQTCALLAEMSPHKNPKWEVLSETWRLLSPEDRFSIHVSFSRLHRKCCSSAQCSFGEVARNLWNLGPASRAWLLAVVLAVVLIVIVAVVLTVIVAGHG